LEIVALHMSALALLGSQEVSDLIPPGYEPSVIRVIVEAIARATGDVILKQDDAFCQALRRADELFINKEIQHRLGKKLFKLHVLVLERLQPDGRA
jgi:hypothetical protein